MKTSNIILGKDVDIHETTSINNVKIGDNVKIAKYCSVFGSEKNQLEIGNNSYIGMFSIINGFSAKLIIGENVSIAQNVNIMVDSGPNASSKLQKIFPITRGSIVIGNNSWIGASCVIMPTVTLGKFCIVGANSYVTKSFEDYSIIGGNPAKLIRKLTENEIKQLNND